MSLLCTHSHRWSLLSCYIWPIVLHVCVQECVCVCVCVCVGVCVQKAGQYRGGGYPVTASGKQYYSTGISHMQCYSATHTNIVRGVCVCECSCAAVHDWVSVVIQVCLFVSEVCIHVCVSDSLRWTDIPGISGCSQGSDSNTCDEEHCTPCLAS